MNVTKRDLALSAAVLALNAPLYYLSTPSFQNWYQSSYLSALIPTQESYYVAGQGDDFYGSSLYHAHLIYSAGHGSVFLSCDLYDKETRTTINTSADSFSKLLPDYLSDGAYLNNLNLYLATSENVIDDESRIHSYLASSNGVVAVMDLNSWSQVMDAARGHGVSLGQIQKDMRGVALSISKACSGDAGLEYAVNQDGVSVSEISGFDAGEVGEEFILPVDGKITKPGVVQSWDFSPTTTNDGELAVALLCKYRLDGQDWIYKERPIDFLKSFPAYMHYSDRKFGAMYQVSLDTTRFSFRSFHNEDLYFRASTIGVDKEEVKEDIYRVSERMNELCLSYL